ncbi:SDR family NAD(P)-dependent oxidoreductase [Litoribacter ruber]|uniref:SDR family NAD(P)-dependent oxidoreductase n=1 Tax=Litoribacter ruber TaxID=702568 RepID=A0AAP2CJZ4_9BACT|nr:MULTISPECIES: SDR family NAD(P)-dependent oxidoreductase [Litoribacter]MBS9523965.1 SDR family NAD(P)-dependent oxidoreductase [Litoribacter alkaliphilus]MBT0811440.1 SDR family NAD(P)-dependent oxidoreductase [Litoribacter ruber]
MEIEGKLAIVTGVSKGIGYQVVTQLLEKGVKVAGWGRSHPDLYHDNFTFFPCDVSRESSVEEAYKSTKEKYGKEIHILINNAGYGQASPIDEMKSEDWEKMFQTNVHGIYYATKRIVPHMKKMEEGHVVNISSIAGLNGLANFSAYCATKHAVRGISHSLYMELRDFGIKVSTIYPGSTQTQFFDDIDGMESSENMMRPEDVATTIVQMLETHPNFFIADVECRPLQPKGKKK